MVNGATGAINDTAPTVAQGEINVHSIEVGKREHLFTPNSINALPGDIITFKFWPGSHSVIRASYGRPCEPYENIQGNEDQGFYSSTMTPDDVDVGQGTLPTWNLTINTTFPTFFYCGAPGSCINWAMVGAINADAEHSIVSQIQSARKAKYVLLPGDSIPHDASSSVQSTRTDASITGATNSQPPSSRASTTSSDEELVPPKSAEDVDQHSQAPISAGAIAGVVIGVVALVIFATGFFCEFTSIDSFIERHRDGAAMW
ncbi:hypothetical protein Q7P35_005519 [Cladosporium inversicolor]